MKPEGMSEAAWLDVHKVIAEIELRIESEITSKIKPQAMAEERQYRLGSRSRRIAAHETAGSVTSNSGKAKKLGRRCL